MEKRSAQSGFARAVKKFFYFAFVAVTFIAYALENHGSATSAAVPATGGASPTPGGASPTSASNGAGSSGAGSASGASPNNSGGFVTLTPAPGAATATAPAQAPAFATATPPAAFAQPTTVASPTAAAPAASSGYKDGTYTGPSVDVRYGLVQVQATIQGGKISSVQFLQYPQDRRTSQRINSVAVPELQQEALQAQSANVDIITGATLTSEGFQQSLQSALSQAKG